MSTRRSELPFYKIYSEIACAPLCSQEAFEFCVDDLCQETTNKNEHSFREAIEDRLIRSYPSLAVDEFAALRDWIWLGNSSHREKQPRTMAAYLESLASSLLSDEGSVLAPSVRDHDTLCEIVGDNLQSSGREYLSWLKRSMPIDLLANVYRAGCHVDALSQSTKHLLKQGYAETHLHLGASISFEQLWPCVLGSIADSDFRFNDFQSRNSAFDHGRGMATWLIRAAIIRVFLAKYLFLDHDNKTFREYWSTALNSVNGSAHVREVMASLIDVLRSPKVRTKSYSAERFSILQHLYRNVIGPRQNQISDMVALYREDPIFPIVSRPRPITTQAEEVFVDRALRLIRKPRFEDLEFQRLFWQVQRVRCLFYQHITQQKSVHGLVWFTRFYRRISPARHGKLTTSGEICAAAETAGFGQGLRSLEVRVAPSVHSHEILSEVKEVAETAMALNRLARGAYGEKISSLEHVPLGKYIEHHNLHSIFKSDRRSDTDRSAFGSEATADHSTFEMGIVFHFVKEREKGSQEFLSAFGRSSHENPILSPSAPYRYGNLYKKIQAQANAMIQVLRQYPLSLQWIRGIDICNDELANPTWLFVSPFRRIIAASKKTSADLKRQLNLAVSPVRPTSHIGEDFVHLLTGLRRVDEALDFLGFNEGCRIGHGLVLGADPIEWAQNIGLVAMDKMTRLHDLLWEWTIMDRLTESHSSSRAHFVQSETYRLIDDLFSHWEEGRKQPQQLVPNKPTINDLVTLRKNLSDPKMLNAVGYPDAAPGVVYDVYNRPDFPTERLREKKILFQYLTDPVLFENGRNVTLVRTEGTGAILKTVQDGVRRKLANRGVLVEVNPSSNEVVGGFSSLKTHPVWRLTSPDYDDAIPEIDVCIGSDDPLVFATDLRQEYQRLIDALAAKGHSDRTIDHWIAKVRENSMASRATLSRISHVPVDALYFPVDRAQRYLNLNYEDD